ncbi:MAG TPA: hypothetical protein VFW71_06110 [Actinomycetota bacterium]|nr:hypothetical protein [Actinomycetota bacterium]
MAHNTMLIGVELLASSVWVGSLVCLPLVAAAARESLTPDARVALFRSLGRRYGIVGNGALALAIAVGLALAWPPSSWSGLEVAAVILTGALVALTAVGVRQARAMTRLRRRFLGNATDEVLAGQVHRGGRVAAGLRGLIAAFTLAIVVVVARIVGS